MYWYYKVYGLTVKSEVQLIEAVEISNSFENDVTITYGTMPEFIKEKYSNGYVNSIAQKKYSWFYFPNEGHFYIQDGCSIVIELDPTAEMHNVSSLILGAAFSYIMYQRDVILLHGSCISFRNKGVVISGISGAGKSTLTMEFLLNGAKLLSDDCVAISNQNSEYEALPAYPQLKLCRNTAIMYNYQLEKLRYIDEDKDKFAVKLENEFYNSPIVISSLFIIEKKEECEASIERIEGARKLEYILNNLYNYHCYQRQGMDYEVLQKVIGLSKQIEVFLIKRPEGRKTNLYKMLMDEQNVNV